MRGQQERIPANHPLRGIRKLADHALDQLNPTCCELHATEGRPSVPPEHPLLASLLQAWASHASLERIDGQDDPPPPPSVPGEGFGAPKEGLSNQTHRSSSDPAALLARKSNAHPAVPSYRGHGLMDHRHDLIVDCRVTLADGYGEREAAKAMAAELSGAHQNTIGADKNDDTKGFVAEVRRLGVTPHGVQNTARPGGSAIDGRTTRHKGYTQWINARRGIEKVCSWIKQFAGLRQFKLRGEDNVSAVVGLHVIAYNLIGLGNILKPVMEVA